MAALDGLDSVDWEGLSHAHGNAGDVPQAIRDLLSPDAAERKAAMSALFATIWHQGTVYPATVHALPFLIELLSSRATVDHESLALLVASIMAGKGFYQVHFSKPLINPFTREPVKPPPDLEKRRAAEAKIVAEVRRIGSRAVAALLPYLTHAHPEFRADVARALAHQKESASLIVPALEHAWSTEQDEAARVAIGSALSALR
jgi:hypothetical protein